MTNITMSVFMLIVSFGDIDYKIIKKGGKDYAMAIPHYTYETNYLLVAKIGKEEFCVPLNKMNIINEEKRIKLMDLRVDFKEINKEKR